jgi:hypothetical protein
MATQFHIPEPSRGLAYQDPMPTVYIPKDRFDKFGYWKQVSTHVDIKASLRAFLGMQPNKDLYLMNNGWYIEPSLEMTILIDMNLCRISDL